MIKEPTIEEKQDYLRKQVVENGHDPEDFVDYCLKNIGNIDMEAWTFHDLEQVLPSNIFTNNLLSFRSLQIVRSYINSKENDPNSSFIQYNNKKDGDSSESEELEGYTSRLQNLVRSDVGQAKQQQKTQEKSSPDNQVPEITVFTVGHSSSVQQSALADPNFTVAIKSPQLNAAAVLQNSNNPNPNVTAFDQSDPIVNHVSQKSNSNNLVDDFFKDPFAKKKKSTQPLMVNPPAAWDFSYPVTLSNNSKSNGSSLDNSPSTKKPTNQSLSINQFDFINIIKPVAVANEAFKNDASKEATKVTKTNFDSIFNSFQIPMGPSGAQTIAQQPTNNGTARSNSSNKNLNHHNHLIPTTDNNMKVASPMRLVSTHPPASSSHYHVSPPIVPPINNCARNLQKSPRSFSVFDAQDQRASLSNNQTNFRNLNRESAETHKPQSVQTNSPQLVIKSQETASVTIVDQDTKNRSQIPKTAPDQSHNFTEPVTSAISAFSSSNKPRSKSTINSSKIKYNGPKVITEDEHDTVKCAKAVPRNVLDKPGVQFEIYGHQIVNRNFFVPDYVLYLIRVKGVSNTPVLIKRKYNHFERLRSLLSKFYPCFRLSCLEKNAWLAETDLQNIRIQKVMIQYFMNDLLLNKQFRNSRIVEEFLTIKEYKNLKAKLCEYEKLAKPKGLEELCLLSGEVQISYSQQNRIYIDKFTNYLGNMENSLDKYKKLLQQLTRDQSAVVKTYQEIIELVNSMESTTNVFNSSVDKNEFYQFEKTMNSLTLLYKYMSESVKFETKLIDTDFKPFLKFERDNISTMRELVAQRNKFCDAYQRIPPVSNKKEVYFAPSLAQYKQSLEEPSKNPTVLKYQCGFYSEAVTLEAQRLFQDMTRKLDRKILDFSGAIEKKRAEQARAWHGTARQIQNVAG